MLARLGNESHYRAVVEDAELDSLLARSGFVAVDDKGFNTELKVAWRYVPDAQRDAFMESWLAFELELNEHGIGYWPHLYRTRNVILENMGAAGIEPATPRV